MRFNILVLTTILSATVFFVGCGKGTDDPGGNTTNRSAAANVLSNNAAGAPSNANNPLGTTKTPEAATSNNAPTLTSVVQGYYAALQKKDEAGVKKFLSQSALRYWEGEMKSEKKTSLLGILEENESPIGEKREVRNEKIDGNTGVAEMKGGSLGVWTKVKFVRESGEWKFASPEESPEFEGISKSPSNSSASK